MKAQPQHPRSCTPPLEAYSVPKVYKSHEPAKRSKRALRECAYAQYPRALLHQPCPHRDFVTPKDTPSAKHLFSHTSHSLESVLEMLKESDMDSQLELNSRDFTSEPLWGRVIGPACVCLTKNFENSCKRAI